MIHISWWGWRYNETTSSRPLVLCLKEARRSLGIKNSRACLRSNDGIKWWGGRGDWAALYTIIALRRILRTSRLSNRRKGIEEKIKEKGTKGGRERNWEVSSKKLEKKERIRKNTREYKKKEEMIWRDRRNWWGQHKALGQARKTNTAWPGIKGKWVSAGSTVQGERQTRRFNGAESFHNTTSIKQLQVVARQCIGFSTSVGSCSWTGVHGSQLSYSHNLLVAVFFAKTVNSPYRCDHEVLVDFPVYYSSRFL